MVLVERFFSRTTTVRTQKQKHSHSHPIILLSGPPSSGKTSLLFQFAYNSAMEEEEKEEEETQLISSSLDNNNHNINNVLFICNRRSLESNPPFLSQDVDPSSDTFQRIQMKYVEDGEGINKYFAAFHLHHTFPSTIVIDDFGDFFHDRSCQEKYGNPRGRELAMVRSLALCHNAIIHANETRPCKLLLSDTHLGDSPRLLFIYKRWVSTIFKIKGDGFGSFILKKNGNLGNGSSETKKAAKYSIALHYLYLEGITEDCEP